MKEPVSALAPFLGPLKDFQRRTVDYVFKRLYLDDPPASRFLVADEAGLGKTLVARGIIARALHHLYDEIERIDVIYVCSNAAIATQNLNRLNVTGERDLTFATRLTLLPAQVKDLRGNKINLVSFTPNTTFDLKSSGGRKEERADIYTMLSTGGLYLRKKSLTNLLQCTAGRRNWKSLLKWRQASVDLDDDLSRDFVAALKKDHELLDRLREACSRFAAYRRRVPPEDKNFRYSVIGDLRRTLAEVCINALEPDLVILDEFQRFRDLLDGQSEAAELARSLLKYKDVRVLLLSATPYKMLTLSGDEDEDHYEDFMRTVGFLLGDSDRRAELEDRFADYRRLLLRLGGVESDVLRRTKDNIERTLLSVMVRNERVASTRERDAMVCDRVHEAPLERRDLHQARLVDGVSRAVETYDPIEYWKSAPYLLNLMKDYKLKIKFRDALAERNVVIEETLERFQDQLLQKADIDAYREIDPANGRLRALIRDTVGAGHWQLLWVPPALPYWAPRGAFEGKQDTTKSLIFSNWTVVPDVIAAMTSYVAERQMMGEGTDGISYGDLTERRKALLVFKLKDGEPQSMTSLGLLYPCVTLARDIDPLKIACKLYDGTPVKLDGVREKAREIVEQRLRATGLWPTEPDYWVDERWYWAALGLLDGVHTEQVGPWMQKTWSSAGPGQERGEGGFADHIRLFKEVVLEGEGLGPAPDDLVDVLIDLALAGPAVCALRALGRVVQTKELHEAYLLSAAVAIAEGFRSLYNHPEVITMLRAEDGETPYWRHVLRYGIDGNLPALLDEYLHVLKESLGLIRHTDDRVAAEISEAVQEALAMRTAVIRVDEYVPNGEQGFTEEEFRLRCWFGVRFGELRDDTGATLARAGTVRQAFNSPFRPFVLASTSIGQEGLDFHTYCHALYHWNLPSNPVDFEQREGRVHRYKGHAIRKNVARQFGLGELCHENLDGRDPWNVLFELARECRPAGSSDLIPFWVYEVEDGAKVERRIPMLPLSREVNALEWLKSSLAVYRLAFGQPRQEDLLAHLDRQFGHRSEDLNLDALRVSLKPPEVEIEQRISEDFTEFVEERWKAEVSNV